MCYAIPAKLVKIEKSMGIVDYFGEKRKILLDQGEAKEGDYVYAQGGVFIKKIPRDDALEIMETWKEIFLELKKVDKSLAKINKNEVSQNILEILQKINYRKSLQRDELKSLFSLQKKNELTVLYEVANHVRERSHGNASCVHGIIEFSNYCRENCFYCGIRRDRKILRYRMSAEEIIAKAKNSVDNYGFKAIVLQSGEDSYYKTDVLEHIVREVRNLGVLVFVSIGFRDIQVYQKLYNAGARAALLRFETSNEKIFKKLRPGTCLSDRIKLIREIKKIGYVLATGFILGLPGETTDDILNNILLTKYLGPDMYSFGPLIPTKETPLEKERKYKISDILKTIAIARLADANSNILVTTALETLDKTSQKKALMAGANSMMINLTPFKFKEMYSIYDNRAGIKEKLSLNVENVVELLYSLGRAPTDLGLFR